MSSISIGAWRIAKPALTALACVAGLGGVALGQASFDPYNPSTGMYREFVTPSYPANLGLPGQARQAYTLQRDALYGTKVGATPYERFLRDGYEDIFTPNSIPSDTSRGRPGVPYYRVDRGVSTSAPASQADRDFMAIRKERDRRYFEAIAEKDPVKRARLLRRVNEPIDPADIPSEADLAKSKPAETGSGIRISRNREPVPSQLGRERADAVKGLTTPKTPLTRMPLAGEPLSGLPATGRPNLSLEPAKPADLVPDPLKPRTGATTTPPTGRRRPGMTGPERRPLLPSEIVDRNRRAAEAERSRSSSTPSNTDNTSRKP